MNITIDTKKASKYRSRSQKVRVITEAWVEEEIFCPNCGTNLNNYENSRPVADFYCAKCREEYELKSKKDSMSNIKNKIKLKIIKYYIILFL